jgi:hypothetical protein
MFMPGPLELIVLASMCGLPVIVVLVVLAVVKGKPAAPPAGPACPNCGGWTVPQANYCQWCGKTLGTGPGSSSTP